MLRRKRKDNDKLLIDRLCIATTHDSTHVRIRNEYPHLELVALCDPTFVICKTDGGGEQIRYVGPVDGIDEPGRYNANPDMCIAQIISDHIKSGYPDAYWRNSDGT